MSAAARNQEQREQTRRKRGALVLPGDSVQIAPGLFTPVVRVEAFKNAHSTLSFKVCCANGQAFIYRSDELVTLAARSPDAEEDEPFDELDDPTFEAPPVAPKLGLKKGGRR